MRKYIILFLLWGVFGNAQYNLFARQNFSKKADSFSFLLDTYPNAIVAYSFRKLRSGYIGDCIKVRRSSDNTTLDIGFVSNVLDTASLLSFVGSGDGFIDTWYDQSGNSNDAVKFVLGGEPKIAISGVVVVKNGNIAFSTLHDNSCDLRTENTINVTYDSVFSVFSIETTGNDAYFTMPFTSGINGADYYGFMASALPDGTANYSGYNGAIPLIYKNNSNMALTNSINALTPEFKTGSIVLSSVFFAETRNVGRAFKYPAANRGGKFHVQEHILFGTNLTSLKSDIQTAINAYYSIY